MMEISVGLRKIVADITGIAEEKLDPRIELWEMGVDSILSMKILQEVETQFGLKMYVNELQENNTIQMLGDYIAKELKGGTASSTAGGMPAGKAAASRPVVFLISTPRAGSTLLRVMLMGHSRIFAPPELHLLQFDTLKDRSEVLLAKKQGYLKEGLIESFAELEGLSPDQAISRVKSLEEKALSVSETYRKLQELAQGRFVVDKSPTYAAERSILDRAEKTTQDPFYLFLVRHPLAVMESFVRNRFDKMLDLKEEPWTYAERMWCDYNRTMRAFLSTIPSDRWMQVQYEALVKSPEKAMKDICSRLKIDFEEAMARPYEGKRMTGGLHQESITIGDPNFLKHDRIEASLADSWNKGLKAPKPLMPETITLARELGYAMEALDQGAPLQEATTYPISISQRSVFKLRKLPHWGIVRLMEIQMENGLDMDRFENSVKKLVQKHPVLRRYFSVAEDGTMTQYQTENIDRVPIVYEDLTKMGPAEQKERLAIMEKELVGKMKITSPLLIAFSVAKVGKEQYVVIMILHILIIDGYSCGLVQNELFDFYYHPEKTAPAADPRYEDYVTKTVNLVGSPVLQEHKLIWAEHARKPQMFPLDNPEGKNTVDSERTHIVKLAFTDIGITDDLIKGKLYHYLSIALYRMLAKRAPDDDPVFAHRMNRRYLSSIGEYPDTVGRFAGDFPLRFSVKAPSSVREQIRKFQKLLQSLPMGALTYEIMAQAGMVPPPRALSAIVLNHQPWEVKVAAPHLTIETKSHQFETPSYERFYKLDFVFRYKMDLLILIVKYSENLQTLETIKKLTQELIDTVQQVILDERAG